MTIDIGLSDILLISPMIVMFLASLIPIFIKVMRGNVEQPAFATLVQCLGGIATAAGLLIVFSGESKLAFYQALIFDGLTMTMGFVALMAAAGACILLYENEATKGRQFSELMFLTMSSANGMLFLLAAQDLLMVFIGMEMMSLSLYLMIAMSHEEKLSKEAAFKYFILGGLASAIFLYGVSFIFGSAGTTYISSIVKIAPDLIATSRIFLFGLAFVTLGFCFKVSIAPFHAWTPDVYQGAPTPLSAYMATAVKAVSFAALLRIIMTGELMYSENMLDILQWMAVLTMIIGNVAAVLQDTFKRMLAYSSIAHSGYILVGIITTGISEAPVAGASAVIFYMIAYSLMTLGAFAIACIFEKNEDTQLNTEDMAGFAKKHPMLAMCLTVFLLSLAGIPPLVGFFGKFYLFAAALGEGLIWLALWGVNNSVISVYYYLRPVVVMYMKEGTADEAPHSLIATKVLIFVVTIFVVGFGIISGPIYEMVERALL
ncbi:MAG: NADH-quinone oxidoreductase subunit N [Pseudobdellovibrionaceae bacterium]